MRIKMLKSKLHRATVTDADLEYEGSISIDKRLCDRAGLLENEQVDVYNCNNGARLTTYVLYGEPGQVCLNGAAARHVHRGDLVIIAAYAEFEQEEALTHKPKVILLDSDNEPKTLAQNEA